MQKYVATEPSSLYMVTIINQTLSRHPFSINKCSQPFCTQVAFTTIISQHSALHRCTTHYSLIDSVPNLFVSVLKRRSNQTRCNWHKMTRTCLCQFRALHHPSVSLLLIDRFQTSMIPHHISSFFGLPNIRRICAQHTSILFN